jgi:hypothetical protein
METSFQDETITEACEKLRNKAFDGRSVRATGRTEQFNFRCRKDLKERVVTAAAQEGISVSAWLERAIERAIDPQPAGNVYTIMADLLLPGKAKDRVDLTVAHQAYVRICRNQAKKPVSPETFVKAMERLCKEGGIPLRSIGEGVYLILFARGNLGLQAGEEPRSSVVRCTDE